MSTSQNGWHVVTSAADLTQLEWITGRVHPALHSIFDALCRRFDAEVEPIRRDWSWGWAYRPIRGRSTGWSNHASGCAIDLNAPAHPIGKANTFTAAERRRIHAILIDFPGIRWGGDYAGRPDDMHFEWIGTPADAARLTERLTEHLEDDMDEQTVRRIFREELHAAFRNDGDRRVLDLGKARIEDPDGDGPALTLARHLYALRRVLGLGKDEESPDPR